MTAPDPAAGGPTSAVGHRASYRLHRAWWAVCGVLLVLLLTGRWLRYVVDAPPPALDHLLATVMVIEAQLFLWPWATTQILVETGVLFMALLPLVFVRRRLAAWVVHRADGRWRFRPRLVSLATGAMLWLQYLFDVNPLVGLMCALSLVAIWAGRRRESRARPRRRRLPGVGWAAFFACWLLLAHDAADRTAVVLWALVLFVGRPWLRRALGEREVWLCLVLLVMPMNLLPAVVPLAFPTHAGTRLGDGMAYSFCESPTHAMVFASLPSCSSVVNDLSHCGQGRVVAYDRTTLSPVETYRFLSPDYYGRLELLVCLDDEVQVAMQSTRAQGRMIGQTALSFPIASPGAFTPRVAGDGVGTSIAYDAAHEAIFYAGEYTHRVVRIDRRTGEMNEHVGDPLRRPWWCPIDFRTYSGSVVLLTESIHPGRNRLYLADWMQGRYAYAIDLSSLEVVARYEIGDGGDLGISVDPGRDRLFLTGLWGMEVIDLNTGSVIARRRLGLGNRPVVIDPAHGRLYVSSSVEGKIHVLDRDSFVTIGQIAIGLGSRYSYLSRDRKRFFASSSLAHYVWDADALGARGWNAEDVDPPAGR